jgi:hypothetical protein
MLSCINMDLIHGHVQDTVHTAAVQRQDFTPRSICDTHIRARFTQEAHALKETICIGVIQLTI